MSLSQIIKQLIELIKRHKIIFGIFIFLFIYILIQPKNTTTKTNTGTITPTIQISPTQIILPYVTESPDITDSDPDYPLKYIIPYKGQVFIVNKYIAPLELEVIIKNEEAISTVEPLLKEWLKGKEIWEGQNKIIWKYEE